MKKTTPNRRFTSSRFAKRNERRRTWVGYVVSIAFAASCLCCPAIVHSTPPPDRTNAPAPLSSKTNGLSSNDLVNGATIARTYDQPRIRYIHGTKSVVRSGPSEKYYATTTLPSSTRVDVYLETSDGWSGIRPPVGSHNWIPAKNAYLLPGGKIAEITMDETPAWVGTDSDQVKQLMWQTGLVKTQQVQILGEEYQTNEDGNKQLWYRIDPPQGEFRWVRTAVLVDTIPVSQSDSKLVAKHEPDSSSVIPASFANPIGSGVVSATATDEPEILPKGTDGEVVWSNESEVLSKINREIANEQSQLNRQLPGKGKPIANTSKGSERSLIVEDGEAITMDDSMNEMTPEQVKRAKRRQAAQHQTDAFAHWDALQEDANPKLRAKPFSSILGLIGLGIVEAERPPVRTEMMRARHEYVPQGHSLRGVGPYGPSRLDHLPRPGRRPAISNPGATVYEDSYSSWNPGDNRTYEETRPVLDRLFQSDQPLFGQSAQAGEGRYGPSNYDTYPHHSTNSSTGIADGWTGRFPSQSSSISMADHQAYDEPLKEADFGTPEIRRAMLELSSAVSKPEEHWDLSQVRRQCQYWIDQGQTALVRGEARLLMDRIEQFDALRIRTLNHLQTGLHNGAMLAQDAYRNSQQSNTLSIPFRDQVAPVTTASATNPTLGASFASATNPGDATGWLVQVHGTLQGQPEYALTDDSGKVLTYVRSTAALNLRRYLQQPVMIQGVRGYIPSLAANQIVAERVVRLR